MEYPIKTTDLKDIDVATDEQATLLVVEAILDSTLNELDFTGSLTAATVIEKLHGWEKFEEYVEIIKSQKDLFLLPIKDAKPATLFNQDAADELALKAIGSIKPVKQGSNYSRSYKFIGVAASILVITFSFSLLISNNISTNSGSKSSSRITFDTSNDSSSPQVAADESTDSTNGLSGKPTSGLKSPNETKSGADQDKVSGTDGDQVQLDASSSDDKSSSNVKRWLRIIVLLTIGILFVLAVIGFISSAVRKKL